jgi:hypothetical protein
VANVGSVVVEANTQAEALEIAIEEKRIIIPAGLLGTSLRAEVHRIGSGFTVRMTFRQGGILW